MNDGLQTGEFIAATISGNSLSVGTSQISSAELGSGAVLSANISGAQVLSSHIASGNVLSAQISGAQVLASHHRILGTGSPTVFGRSIQHGTATATDVAVWTVFGTAFAAAPQVQLTCAASGTANAAAPMLVGQVVGSFGFLGQSGLAYNWLAIGSGAL